MSVLYSGIYYFQTLQVYFSFKFGILKQRHKIVFRMTDYSYYLDQESVLRQSTRQTYKECSYLWFLEILALWWPPFMMGYKNSCVTNRIWQKRWHMILKLGNKRAWPQLWAFCLGSLVLRTASS
jgi:hypothetical protein